MDCVTNLSCTTALSSLWLPLLFGSNMRTKLSGNMPVMPLAFNVPCHQPPGICLMRWMMAPFCRSSSSGSFAAYSYSTIAQIAAKRERGRQRRVLEWFKKREIESAVYLVRQWGNLIWDTRIFNGTVQVQIFTIAPQLRNPQSIFAPSSLASPVFCPSIILCYVTITFCFIFGKYAQKVRVIWRDTLCIYFWNREEGERGNNKMSSAN